MTAVVTTSMCLPVLLAAGVGLFIGVLLLRVITRLPVMMQRESDNYVAAECGREEPHQDRFNFFNPAPACAQCGAVQPWSDRLPVVGYLRARGGCGQCAGARSRLELAVPLVSAVLSGALVWRFGTGPTALFSLLLAYALITLSAIDAKTQLLPDAITLPLLWLGLLVNTGQGFVPLQDAVVGAAAGYMSLWSIFWVFRLVTGKEGMGYGDFKLLAALGAWLGWQMLPLVILLSALGGAVVGIALMTLTKWGRDNPIPFGPYLAGAGLVALAYGREITDAYLLMRI